MMKTTDKLTSLALKVLPYKFLRHYVYPFFVRKKKEQYNAKDFFNSYYSSAEGGEFSDEVTVSLHYDGLSSKYHYNAAENAILEVFIKHRPGQISHMLDIGSGAGHWIDFYINTIKVKQVTGYDISPVCISRLKKKYENNDKVSIQEVDISSTDFKSEQKFDLVNAVGVMFHIVNDENWNRAVKNLASVLKPGGHLIVGGQFGWISQYVQFHNSDNFNKLEDYKSYTSINELKEEKADKVYVNKKVRSLSVWKKQASDVGLTYVDLVKTRENESFITPENNMLVFIKK